jgi:hypothetical protein
MSDHDPGKGEVDVDLRDQPCAETLTEAQYAVREIFSLPPYDRHAAQSMARKELQEECAARIESLLNVRSTSDAERVYFTFQETAICSAIANSSPFAAHPKAFSTSQRLPKLISYPTCRVVLPSIALRRT